MAAARWARGAQATSGFRKCRRVPATAVESGIGLTLLPVLYERGGCDNRPLAGSQRRFGCSLNEFADLTEGAEAEVANLENDCVVGADLLRCMLLARIQ